MNLPIYNKEQCEAKDICVVIENKTKTKSKKTSSTLHLVLSFGPIILSSPLCIAWVIDTAQKEC